MVRLVYSSYLVTALGQFGLTVIQKNLAPDSLVRGPGFDTLSGNIHVLSFLLLLIQDGQLSVTGQSMCMKYWLTA